MDVSEPAALTYAVGDATNPEARPVIIAHICNDVGAWGAGFVVPLGIRYPKARNAYRAWFRGGLKHTPTFRLSNVQIVEVAEGVHVANMIAQHGLRTHHDCPPIRYDALELALEKVADVAKTLGATIAMPRIGTGLAGGRWSRIEAIIKRTCVHAGVNVVVYTLP